MSKEINFTNQIANEDILKEINTTVVNKKTGFLQVLIMFAITALLFIGAGLISIKIEQLIILAIVLLIHESGHFLSMKRFGYSNVKMFFLPFFGAATSGNERKVNATEEALVALSGPLPGIFVGIILTLLYGKSGKEIYYDFGMWFLFLNGFNLLPFYPLDGGRFFNAVIFSRNYVFELLFKIGTGILLSLIAFTIKAYILLIIPFILIASLRASYYSSKAARAIKKDLSKEQILSFKLDVDHIKAIREKLDVKTFASEGFRKVKYMSFVIHDVWKRICLIPPKITTTILLIIAYFAVSFSGLVSIVVISDIQLKKNTRYELSTVTDKDNKVTNLELVYFKNKIQQKTELDLQFRYHGKREIYLPNGSLEWIGYFYHGVPDGEGTQYSKNIILKFDKGKFLSKKQFKNGIWVETPSGNLPKYERIAIEGWIKKQKPFSKLRPVR